MVSKKMMRGSGGSGQGIGEGISTPWLVGRHESGDRGVVQVWHCVLSQSVHLDSESTTDTPTHHHNDQSSTTKGPMHKVRCESSRSSQAVYGWSRKEGWPQSTEENAFTICPHHCTVL